MSCVVYIWDLSPSAAPLLNFTYLVMGSFTVSAMPHFLLTQGVISTRGQIPEAPHISQPDSRAACYSLFFPVVNTFIMFSLTGDWKNRAATSWDAGCLAVKWQHLVCTWVQSPTSGVWRQEMKSRWAAALFFVLFFGPQVFLCTAET